MKLWLIVNLFEVELFDPGDKGIIPHRARPSFIHDDKDKAENELLRLQAKHPGAQFVLFESAAKAVRINGFKSICWKINPIEEEVVNENTSNKKADS
jgi:hypothetical protein